MPIRAACFCTEEHAELGSFRAVLSVLLQNRLDPLGRRTGLGAVIDFIRNLGSERLIVPICGTYKF